MKLEDEIIGVLYPELSPRKRWDSARAPPPQDARVVPELERIKRELHDRLEVITEQRRSEEIAGEVAEMHLELVVSIRLRRWDMSELPFLVFSVVL